MSELADKSDEFLQREEGGLRKVKVVEERRKVPALSDKEALEISKMLLLLEEEMGRPQDVEWALERGRERETWCCFVAGVNRELRGVNMVHYNTNLLPSEVEFAVIV